MGNLAKIVSPRNLTVGVILVIGIVIGVGISAAPPAKKTSRASFQAAHPATQNTAQVTSQASRVTVSTLTGAAPGSSADNLLPLGKDIGNYIDKQEPGSSVYLEDINAGHALHIGQTKAYDIKSLMKVPLVMSLYKAAENGQLSLDDKIALTPSELDSDFGDLWQKKAGYELTLGDAAKLALQQSDNTAIHAINDHVYPLMPSQERAYSKTNLDIYTDPKGNAYVSTASYSNVFRCLVNACYNNRQDSDAILELMKHTDFNDPSRQLPAGVEVSHKIGSVSGADGTGFNDCGIVYGKSKPFLFCIMLTVSQPQAGQDIGTIVKRAYDYLEK